MEKRTAFPAVFWIANSVEVLERFAYYGIYFGFGIYLASLGFAEEARQRDPVGFLEFAERKLADHLRELTEARRNLAAGLEKIAVEE